MDSKVFFVLFVILSFMSVVVFTACGESSGDSSGCGSSCCDSCKKKDEAQAGTTGANPQTPATTTTTNPPASTPPTTGTR